MLYSSTRAYSECTLLSSSATNPVFYWDVYDVWRGPQVKPLAPARAGLSTALLSTLTFGHIALSAS